MKTLTKSITTFPSKGFAALGAFIFSVLFSITSFAQDATKKVDVDISTDSGPAWYGQPWIWVVGVAIFIVIIVAITRNNRNDG